MENKEYKTHTHISVFLGVGWGGEEVVFWTKSSAVILMGRINGVNNPCTKLLLENNESFVYILLPK